MAAYDTFEDMLPYNINVVLKWMRAHDWCLDCGYSEQGKVVWLRSMNEGMLEFSDYPSLRAWAGY